MLFCLQRGESLTPRELHLEGERAAAFQNLWQDTLTKTIGLISERHHVIRRVAEALAGRLLTQANLDALIKSGRRMTDTTELAAILELAVLQLLDWGAVTSCFVPDDTTDADLDAARVIVRRRFCESGRLDLVQRLDTAIIEIMMLQWEA